MVIRHLIHNAQIVCIALACAATYGCSDSDDPAAGDDASDTGEVPQAPQGLAPEQILTRASLDVRGVRPTVAELASVTNDPSSLDATIATFVDDPAFGERIKGMFAGAWRTRIDEYYQSEEDFDERGLAFAAAVGEEPLNLIAYVAINDLPFTEVVKSADTFVDPLLLEDWPLQQAEGADGMILPPGVVRARYTDGRPVAGVLSMNAVFWRHSSTVENANRGRANALSQALLCQSYLDRPIDFPTDVDLTDSESIKSAIRTNAACQACHSTLDPMASYLWGFMYGGEQASPTYSVPGERMWQVETGTAPGFFGKGGERLADLGVHVAGDERFVSCAVRRVYEGMLGRSVELQDEGALADHREAFLSSGLSLKALVRSILADPSYRGEPSTPVFGGMPTPVIKKVAPVDVVEQSLTALSGYRLTFENRPAVRLDEALRRIAGGSDRGDTTNMSTGAVLVQRRLAEAGAIHAVDAAIDGRPGGGALDGVLSQVDLQQAPTPDTLVALSRLTRSQELDPAAPEIVAMTDLWTAVAAASDEREAWVAVVTVVLADPDHLLY